MTQQQQQDDPPYYSLDLPLFEGTFTYYNRGKEPVQVRGKAHRQDEERFSLSLVEREIETVTTPRGTRTYVHMKPYVQRPEMRFVVGLFHAPDPATGAIGQVIGGPREAMGPKREDEIGQVQAWYYTDEGDRVIVLWECFLGPGLRLPESEGGLLADANMRKLWEAVESFLVGQFPAARRIVTPGHDPIWETAEYRQFLASLGYAPVSTARQTMGKDLEKEAEA